MVFVACSGFPVPVSRYWKEFMSVEISDTELGIPGEGTVRRWVRESPEGFAFTALAPGSVAASGFKLDDDLRDLLKRFGAVAKKLNSKAVVFATNEKFKHSKANRAVLRTFLESLPKGLPPVVLDLPWQPEQTQDVAEDLAIAAYDPLKESPPPLVNGLAYARLPGPAGHRSRYDEPSVKAIAKHCEESESEEIFCVFRNIDMHVNAAALRVLLKQT